MGFWLKLIVQVLCAFVLWDVFCFSLLSAAGIVITLESVVGVLAVELLCLLLGIVLALATSNTNWEDD